MISMNELSLLTGYKGSIRTFLNWKKKSPETLLRFEMLRLGGTMFKMGFDETIADEVSTLRNQNKKMKKEIIELKEGLEEVTDSLKHRLGMQ